MKFIVKKSFIIDNIVPILVGDIIEHHFNDDSEDVSTGILFNFSQCYFFNNNEVVLELSPTQIIEYLEYYKD
jgi:hypothetical protein